MKPTTAAERMLEISSITMSLDWMLTRDSSRRRPQRPAFGAGCSSLAVAASSGATSGGASADDVITAVPGDDRCMGPLSAGSAAEAQNTQQSSLPS